MQELSPYHASFLLHRDGTCKVGIHHLQAEVAQFILSLPYHFILLHVCTWPAVFPCVFSQLRDRQKVNRSFVGHGASDIGERLLKAHHETC